MSTDPASELSELMATLASVEAVLDPDAMRKEADSLRERSADPALWEDQEQAQDVTRRLSYLDGELTRLEALHRRLDDTAVMFELAESEHDEPTRHEAERELAGLRKEIDQLEIRTLLSGEYDVRDQGAVRLRDPARRARHAPHGPHLQVRQPGAPPDLLCHGGRAASGPA